MIFFILYVNLFLIFKIIMIIYDYYLFMINRDSLVLGIFKDKIECGCKYIWILYFYMINKIFLVRSSVKIFKCVVVMCRIFL